MLSKRILSAVVALPIVFYLIWLGGYWYTALICIAAVVGIHEYMKMLGLKSLIPQIYSYISVIAIIVSVHFGYVFITLAVVCAIFVVTALNLLFDFKDTDMAEMASVFWGIMYVGGLLAFLVSLRSLFALHFTVMFFAVIWSNDTAAYFVGKKWGKNKLSPVVSPNKTVEGAVGGVIVPLALVLILHPIIGQHYPLTLGWSVIFTVLIVVVAQVGDLVESAMKRKMKIKESGDIIPGHGGVLDRFDGIIFAAPFAHYFLMIAQSFIAFLK